MPRQLLAAYPQKSPRFDEMLEAPPAAAGALARSVRAPGRRPPPSRCGARVQYVQRQIHENGVTYNVYADPQGTDRPWELDVAAPHHSRATEWSEHRERDRPARRAARTASSPTSTANRRCCAEGRCRRR
ncbi:MAG: hypothetical protein MZW92_79805 [Comamonadaceae bacterium]|nr:hypothetical protein [Comamonadaceae bacterium]